MFSIFRSNKPKYKSGQIYKFKDNDGEEYTFQIIKVDQHDGKNIVSIFIFKNELNNNLPEHLPIFEKALTKSQVTYISEGHTDDIDLDGYRLWKTDFVNGKAGVFDIPIQDILETLPKPSITMLRMDNPEIRDWTLVKVKGLLIHGIFVIDASGEEQLSTFAPYPFERNLKIGVAINDYEFVTLQRILIDNTEVEIGYYDMRGLMGDWHMEMFGIKANNISSDLYETIRRIRLFPPEYIPHLASQKKASLNESGVFYSKQEQKWVFHLDSPKVDNPELYLDKTIGDQFVNKYVEAFNEFIKTSGLSVTLNEDLQEDVTIQQEPPLAEKVKDALPGKAYTAFGANRDKITNLISDSLRSPEGVRALKHLFNNSSISEVVIDYNSNDLDMYGVKKLDDGTVSEIQNLNGYRLVMRQPEDANNPINFHNIYPIHVVTEGVRTEFNNLDNLLVSYFTDADYITGLEETNRVREKMDDTYNLSLKTQLSTILAKEEDFSKYIEKVTANLGVYYPQQLRISWASPEIINRGFFEKLYYDLFNNEIDFRSELLQVIDSQTGDLKKKLEDTKQDISN